MTLGVCSKRLIPNLALDVGVVSSEDTHHIYVAASDLLGPAQTLALIGSKMAG